MTITEKDAARFWSKVSKSDGCWTWTGYVMPFPDGYGMFKVKPRMQLSHRVAWTIENGTIPKGMSVLHSCDNPPCVNPKHLSVGTQAKNMADCGNRKRTYFQKHPEVRARGERSGTTKLRESDVRRIRKMYEAGERQSDIAAAFGIHSTTVSSIVLVKTWKHV